MRDSYMRSGEGFVCVYSVTSRNSFDEIAAFREQILRVKDSDDVPMILVGNKCDLKDDRQVATTDGAGMAKSMGCGFFESSAKERINVDEPFFDLVRAIRRERGKNDTSKAKKGKKKSQCRLL